MKASTDPIDPDRAQRLVKRVVGPMMANGTKVAPFDREDFEQELLLYCYDDQAQGEHGRIGQADADTYVLTVLKRRAQAWRQWTYDTRAVTDGGVGFSLDNRDHAEVSAFDLYGETETRVENDAWRLGEDLVDVEAELWRAEEQLEKSLRAVKAAAPPQSETQRAIRHALKARPGESSRTDALRRCVAWAALQLLARDRDKPRGDRKRYDDVRLMIRRLRYGERLTPYEKNRMTRVVLPNMAREMNRYLRGERDPVEDGPGSRQVRRRYTPGDGDYPWDAADVTEGMEWEAVMAEFGPPG